MLNRRHFLASAAAAAPAVLASCSSRRPRNGKPLVSIVRAAGYDQGIYDSVRRALAEHKLDVRGKRILLKPNLVEFDAGAPVNTNPILVHAAFEAFRGMGAAEVLIGEGPGHRRNSLDLAEAAGYFDIFQDFERLFTDLNTDDVALIPLQGSSSRLNQLYLPRVALAADMIVSIPKMKTHHWAAATLSMKNLFGLVPGGVYGWPKNVLHWAGIHECIADLYRAFPRTFALVDGIVGMEGNGPIQGVAKQAGVLVAGSDPAAVDATCCRIMGIDPAKVGYLNLVAAGGLDEGAVPQIGESLRTVRTSFELIPDFHAFRLKG